MMFLGHMRYFINFFLWINGGVLLVSLCVFFFEEKQDCGLLQ